jgi:hypothetical protein
LLLFVIPAKAGTQGFPDSRFAMDALDSRLRGNGVSYFSTTNLPPATLSITPVSFV